MLYGNATFTRTTRRVECARITCAMAKTKLYLHACSRAAHICALAMQAGCRTQVDGRHCGTTEHYIIPIMLASEYVSVRVRKSSPRRSRSPARIGVLNGLLNAKFNGLICERKTRAAAHRDDDNDLDAGIAIFHFYERPLGYCCCSSSFKCVCVWAAAVSASTGRWQKSRCGHRLRPRSSDLRVDSHSAQMTRPEMNHINKHTSNTSQH